MTYYATKPDHVFCVPSDSRPEEYISTTPIALQDVQLRDSLYIDGRVVFITEDNFTDDGLKCPKGKWQTNAPFQQLVTFWTHGKLGWFDTPF